jgi:hypothetical protein
LFAVEVFLELIQQFLRAAFHLLGLEDFREFFEPGLIDNSVVVFARPEFVGVA